MNNKLNYLIKYINKKIMIYYYENFPERNYFLDIRFKKLFKDTKKINKLKRAKLSEEQLRNLLEKNLISITEYLLILGTKNK